VFGRGLVLRACPEGFNPRPNGEPLPLSPLQGEPLSLVKLKIPPKAGERGKQGVRSQ